MEPDATKTGPPPLPSNVQPKGNPGVVKIAIGIILIGTQVIRQPGFGFYVKKTFPTDSLLDPTNASQAAGYNLFAASMYIVGVILILWGLRKKKINAPESR